MLKSSQIYFNIAGSEVECNVCHYKTNKFGSDGWHQFSECPSCFSSVRQRLLVASLSLLDAFSFDRLIRNKKVLHFAPEKSLGKMIQDAASVYRTADFLTGNYSYSHIDYRIDISGMNEIPDASFDCVIACDVLEHVPDHRGAMKEVHRILTAGGYCIFTVPQKDNLETTLEDLSITSGKERERMFGQHDHLRIYGNDFVSMLQDSGFEVTAVNESFFNSKTVERFVLFPPVLSTHPLATNYRKIFFGKKK